MLSSFVVKKRALELGFDLAGIAPLGVWKDLEFSRQWVEKGFNGEMRYLENPKRFDPRLVLPSAKSVVCVGLVYNTPLPYSTELDGVSLRSLKSPRRSQEPEARRQKAEERVSGVGCRVPGGEGTLEREAKETSRNLRPQTARAPSPQPLAPFFFNGRRTLDSGQSPTSSFQFPFSSFQFPVSAPAPRAWISRYAWGHDYHEIMRAKLEQLRAALEQLALGVETRVFVDTGPMVERAFARFSGIGWMGKNTCIISQEKGSWFFLGVILTSLELAPDLPAPDRCGSCTACLEACPTGALVEPYVMDASRCISYFTIELKGSIPEEFRPEIGGNVFGCDICQDVCPWNSSRQSSVLSCQSSVVSRQSSVVNRQSSGVSGQPSALSSQPSGPNPQSLAVSDQQAAPWQGPTPDEHRANKQAATTKVPEFHPTIVEPTQPAFATGSKPGQLTTDHGPCTTDHGPRRTAHRPRRTDNGPRTTDNHRLRTTSFQFPVSSFSLFNPPLHALASISEDDFRGIFAHSPIKRVKYRGWLRNLCLAMGNSGDERFVPWLERAAQHSDSIVREHAAWALERLRNK
jgi:epoxyqueuosine reductase QueG